MYLYEPATAQGRLRLLHPQRRAARPPTSTASQDGLFMTNDGRAFFAHRTTRWSTRDTNKAQDVYEYVDGRPQLITTGHRRDPQSAGGFVQRLLNPPGLVGVSADGRDVYFSTYDTLVRQDHNGLFLKFYDARSGRRLLRARPAAAVRSGRRVPRRRQPAAGADAGRHRCRARQRRQRSRRRNPGQAQGKRQHSEPAGARQLTDRAIEPAEVRDEARVSSTQAAPARGRCVVAAALVALLARTRRRERADHRLRGHAVDHAGGGPSRRRGPVRGRKPRPPAQPEPLQLRGRERRDRPPPAGLHRQPPRDAAVHGRRVLRRRLPDRLAGRNRQRRTRRNGDPVRRRRSTTSSRRPTSRACSASRSSSSTRPQFTVLQRPHRRRLRPRRDGDLDLPRCLPARRRSRQVLWGVPADPSHDLLRLDRTKRPGANCRPTSATLCDAERQRSAPSDPNTIVKPCYTNFIGLAPGRSNSPLTPVPPEPDDLRRPAHLLARRPLLRRRHDPRRAPLAADDRLRPAQLQPEPLRAADHERDRLGLRDRRQPHGAPAAQPDHPLAVRAARRHGHPARGLLDQPQRRRRQDRPAPTPKRTSAPTLRGPLPRVLEDRQPRRSTARPCRARCPASSTSASRCPATATGSSSSPTASPPTSSWPARSPPIPQTGQLTITFTEPAAEPADRLQHALLRLRAGPARDPDPVRHLPGDDAPSRPGTRALGAQTSTQFFTLDSGPDGAPCPGPIRPFEPGLPGRLRRATPPAPTPPSRSN